LSFLSKNSVTQTLECPATLSHRQRLAAVHKVTLPGMQDLCQIAACFVVQPCRIAPPRRRATNNPCECETAMLAAWQPGATHGTRQAPTGLTIGNGTLFAIPREGTGNGQANQASEGRGG